MLSCKKYLTRMIFMKILMTICLITSGFANVMDPVEFEKRLPNVVFGKESWGKKDTAELDPLSLSPYFRASENFVKKCFEDGDKDLLSLAIAAGRFGENTEFFQLLYNMERIFGSSSVINRNSRGLVHRKPPTNQGASSANHEPDVESDEEENTLLIPIFEYSESSDEESEIIPSHESVENNEKTSSEQKYNELIVNRVVNENLANDLYKEDEVKFIAHVSSITADKKLEERINYTVDNFKFLGEAFLKDILDTIITNKNFSTDLWTISSRFGTTNYDISSNLKKIDFLDWKYKALYPFYVLIKNNKDFKFEAFSNFAYVEIGREFYEKNNKSDEDSKKMAKEIMQLLIDSTTLNLKDYIWNNDNMRELHKYKDLVKKK